MKTNIKNDPKGVQISQDSQAEQYPFTLSQQDSGLKLAKFGGNVQAVQQSFDSQIKQQPPFQNESSFDKSTDQFKQKDQDSNNQKDGFQQLPSFGKHRLHTVQRHESVSSSTLDVLARRAEVAITSSVGLESEFQNIGEKLLLGQKEPDTTEVRKDISPSINVSKIGAAPSTLTGPSQSAIEVAEKAPQNPELDRQMSGLNRKSPVTLSSEIRSSGILEIQGSVQPAHQKQQSLTRDSMQKISSVHNHQSSRDDASKESKESQTNKKKSGRNVSTDLMQMVRKLSNPVLSKNVTPRDSRLVPKQPSYRYSKGNQKSLRKAGASTTLENYEEKNKILSGKALPQIVTGFQTDIINIPYLQVNQVGQYQFGKTKPVSQTKKKKTYFVEDQVLQSELQRRQQDYEIIGPITNTQNNLSKTRQPSVTSTKLTSMQLQSKLSASGLGRVLESKLVSQSALKKLSSISSGPQYYQNSQSNYAHDRGAGRHIQPNHIVDTKMVKVSKQHHKKLGQKLHRQAIQNQLNYQKQLIKDSGPQYMISGTYRDIYSKILDGGYNSMSAEKTMQSKRPSTDNMPTATQAEDKHNQSVAFVESSLDMSKDMINISDNLMQDSLIENTFAIDDELASVHDYLHKNVQKHIIADSYNITQSQGKPANNPEPRQLHESSIHSNAPNPYFHRKSSEFVNLKSRSSGEDIKSSAASMSIFKNMQMNFEVNQGSIRKIPAHNNERAERERNLLEKMKREKQDQFFLSYLNQEIRQIQNISALPSLEALYAAHKNYHPTKVKINMKNDKVLMMKKINQSHSQNPTANFGNPRRRPIGMGEATGSESNFGSQVASQNRWQKQRGSMFPEISSNAKRNSILNPNSSMANQYQVKAKDTSVGKMPCCPGYEEQSIGALKIENSESFNLENHNQFQRKGNNHIDRSSGPIVARISKIEIDRITDQKERAKLTEIKDRNSSQDMQKLNQNFTSQNIAIGDQNRTKRKLLLGQQGRHISQVDAKFPRIESAANLKPNMQISQNSSQVGNRYTSLMTLPKQLPDQMYLYGQVWLQQQSLSDKSSDSPCHRKQYQVMDQGQSRNIPVIGSNAFYEQDEGGSPSISDLANNSLIGTNMQSLQNIYDYEVMLQETLNLENLPNKLQVKKSLISQAVSNTKPNLKRVYAQDIVTKLKDMKVERILDLPGNEVMQLTMKIATDIRTTSSTQTSTNAAAATTSHRPLSTVHSQNSSLGDSQLSSPRSKSSRRRVQGSLVIRIFDSLVKSHTKKRVADGSQGSRIADEVQPRLVNVKDITLRCRDNQPFYDQQSETEAIKKIEAVYISPHFDLKSQTLIDPTHLSEVISEIQFNHRLCPLSKLFLTRRLLSLKHLAPLRSREIKQIIKEIKLKNKGVKGPEEREVCKYLEQLARALYIFVSRPEVMRLEKMGILMQFLSEMLATDIQNHKTMLHHKKLREHDEMMEAAEQALASNLAPNHPQRSKALILISNSSTERKKIEDEIARSLKQKPFQQPRSKEFFKAIKNNEVLKCLNMVKLNSDLVHDCDENRQTPLHWACALNLTNIIQILVDFNGNLNAKDDYARKPMDETITYAQTHQLEPNKYVIEIYDQLAHGKLKRSTAKYDESVYVKYLTPVEQVKELADFIHRVNDMSTLTQKQRDAKAAEEARLRELERKALKKKRAHYGKVEHENDEESDSNKSSSKSSGEETTEVERSAQKNVNASQDRPSSQIITIKSSLKKL